MDRHLTGIEKDVAAAFMSLGQRERGIHALCVLYLSGI
jgi:hypothetical protein